MAHLIFGGIPNEVIKIHLLTKQNILKQGLIRFEFFRKTKYFARHLMSIFSWKNLVFCHSIKLQQWVNVGKSYSMSGAFYAVIKGKKTALSWWTYKRW